MSQDWKRKIDEQNSQAAENKRLREEAQQAAKKAAEEREYQRKLEQHQRKFKCHICGEPSSSPERNRHYNESDRGYIVISWDQPTGLERCKRCNKWTCFDHLYQGTCQKCAG